MSNTLSVSTKRPAWLPDHLFPFRSRFLEIEGCRVHYVDEGSGPTLLLLHGNPTWSFLYREIIKGLSDHFRCIAPDYPGFGLSTASDGYDYRPASHARVLEAFIQALDLKQVTIMMQDWGGPIGFSVAARHPDRFRALIFGNTWAWPLSDPSVLRFFSRVMGNRISLYLLRHFHAVVNVYIPMGVKTHKVPPEVMAAYRGPFPSSQSRLPTLLLARELRKARGFLAQVEAGLDRLTHLPALILWGDHDSGMNKKKRFRFERLFPRHRTVILHGAGHYFQEDVPERVVPAIRAWWEEEIVEPESGPQSPL